MGLKEFIEVFLLTVGICGSIAYATVESSYNYGSQDVCGGNLRATNTTQELLSPDFPLTYHANLHCVWNITTKKRSTYIKLVFDIVQIDESENCESEYLQVHTSKDPDVPATTICKGDYSPHSFLLSAEQYMKVTFVSDNVNISSNSRFRLLYITEEELGPTIVWTEESESTSGIFGLEIQRNPLARNHVARSLFGFNRTGLVGVATDYAEKMLCWTDATPYRGLGCTDIGENQTYSIGVGWETSKQVEGIVIDWISKNYYWIDAYYNVINIGKIVFLKEVILPLIETGLDHPRGIAIHPIRRYLYWTDVGAEPKIERSNLAGEHRRIIVSGELTAPNGITVDVKGGKIFWTNAGIDVSLLESANLDGSNRQSLFELPASQALFFDVTVYKNLIFIADNKGFVRCVKKSNPFRQFYQVETLSSPRTITTHSSWTQPMPDSPCSSNPCSHLCVRYNSNSRYKCLCPKGLVLGKDGHGCIFESVPKNVLMLSTMTKVCFLPDTFPYARLLPLVPTDLCFSNTSALILSITVDVGDELLFIANATSKTISKVSLNQNKTGGVVAKSTRMVEALAVDWIANNLYWVDGEVGTLTVSDYDGNFMATLLTDLGMTKDIVIDPIERVIFWNGMNPDAYIERIALDGTDRKEIVTSDFEIPGGMVVHLEEKRLYFTDRARGTIESVAYDGSDRKIVFRRHKFSQFFKLAIHEDFLVWTEFDVGFFVLNLKTNELVRSYVMLDVALSLVMYSESSQPIGDAACIRDDGGCSQLYIPADTETGWSCMCSYGYTLADDGVTCETKVIDKDFLLVTDFQLGGIFQWDLQQSYLGPRAITSNDKAFSPTGVAYDPEEGMVYWCEYIDGTIYKSSLAGNDDKTVVSQNVTRPTSLAIDPIGQLLFWADIDRKTISVSSLDGSRATTIINEELDAPTSIAIHPQEGSIFFSDVGEEPFIDTAWMNGLARHHIIHENLGQPLGLTIDYEEEKLYWCDAKLKTIEFCDLDGGNRDVLIQFEDDVQLYDLSIFENRVYWLDWAQRSVFMADKFSGDNITVVAENLDSPNNIYIFSAGSNKMDENELCSVENGGCSGICLPKGSDMKECSCGDDTQLSTNDLSCNGEIHFVEKPVDTQLRWAEVFEAQCEVDDDNAAITWFKDGQNINLDPPEGIRILHESTLLFIGNVKRHHAGCYKCRASLPGGMTIETNATFYIKDEDIFCIKPQNSTLMSNDTHHMSCEIQFNGAVVHWVKDDQLLEFGENIKRINETTILIQNVTANEEGRYVCVALSENGNKKHGEVSAWIKLVKRDVPFDLFPQDCGIVTDVGPTIAPSVARLASPVSTPWIARLFHTPSSHIMCAGSLINDQWVLTAASCIKDYDNVTSDEVQIQLASHRANRQTVNAVRIIIHDNYDADNYNNNIALIQLAHPVNFTDHIRPICFPNETLDRQLLEDGNLGKVTFFMKGPKEAFVPVLRNRRCRIGAIPNATDYLFCAAYGHTGPTCHKSTGGAFAMTTNGRWFLMGVVGHIDECSDDKPQAVYTKAEPYWDWAFLKMVEN